jgi:competence protein ComEA
MKSWFMREIHHGWRRGAGVVAIVIGLAGSVYYYAELYLFGKTMDAQADQLVVTLPSVSPMSTMSPTTQASPSSTDAVKQTGKVKLSTATKEQLESLPGIGPSKAQAILDYRATKGFKSVNDLDNVKGIGPATLEKLRLLVEL